MRRTIPGPKATYAEGWIGGTAYGALNMARHLLFELLKDRFGPLPNMIVECLRDCEDEDLLVDAFKQAVRMEKLEDLQLLKPRQPEVGYLELALAESIWEERLTKGEAGGEARGDVEGQLLTMRRHLKNYLEKQFGFLQEKTIRDIEGIIDVQELNAAYHALLRGEPLDASRL